MKLDKPIEEYFDVDDDFLNSLSDSELELIVKNSKDAEKTYNVSNLSLKTLINSMYGAIGNAGFRFYDVRLAEAITTGGQMSIRWIERKLNEFMNKICETQDVDFITYIDTDSVVGSSIINVNDRELTIAQYFDELPNDFAKRDDTNSNYVKLVSDKHVTPSVNERGELEFNRIKYAMKHRVEKRMYRITVNGKSVEVTEDHSIIVKRDGTILSVKPTEIVRGDVLITINESQSRIHDNSDFLIEDIGIVEQDVYDIEVENNHNFFANQILVHNSVYMNVERFVDKMCAKKGIKEADQDTLYWVDLLDKFAKTVCEPYIEKSYQEMAEYLNAFEQRMFMDREVIADCLTGDMMVTMSDDTRKRLDAVSIGNLVKTYNEHTKQIEVNEVTAFMDKGVQDVYLVELDDGRTIQGTADHKIGCIRDGAFCWVNLIDLQETDVVL